MRFSNVLTAVAVLTMLISCAKQPQQRMIAAAQPTPPAAAGVKISKQEFGNDWPFTVNEGNLFCEGSASAGAVLFYAEGTIYAVNGAAKSLKKYKPIEALWLEDPQIPGAKKNLGAVIERGLKLCGRD